MPYKEIFPLTSGLELIKYGVNESTSEYLLAYPLFATLKIGIISFLIVSLSSTAY